METNLSKKNKLIKQISKASDMVPFSDFLLEFMDRYGLNNLRESTVEQRKLKELYGKEAHEKIMDALNVKKSGRTVYIRFIYVWRMQHLYRRTNTEDIIL